MNFWVKSRACATAISIPLNLPGVHPEMMALLPVSGKYHLPTVQDQATCTVRNKRDEICWIDSKQLLLHIEDNLLP